MGASSWRHLRFSGGNSARPQPLANSVKVCILCLDTFQGIFQEFKDTNAKYKQRVRSRVSNLRDVKNPLLKVKVLSGQITPEKFATMPTEVGYENIALTV